MKTKEFLKLLENNPSKEIIFEYREKEFVPKAFHITEVKSVHVDSVDCGGSSHSYDETVVQLWVPANEQKEKGMEASKALKIFNIVQKKNPLKMDTPISFEWGFGYLPTSTYEVKEYENVNDQIIFKLFVPPTVCRPLAAVGIAKDLLSGGCCAPGNSKCC